MLLLRFRNLMAPATNDQKGSFIYASIIVKKEYEIHTKDRPRLFTGISKVEKKL